MGPGGRRVVAAVLSMTALDLYARSCMDSRPVVISVGVGVLSLDKWDTCEAVWICVCVCRVDEGVYEEDDEEGRIGTARRSIRPGAAGAGFTGWKFIIWTCILHLTSSIGVL